MLSERIQKSYPSLTKQQKKVAEFFLSQGSEAAFFSIAELADQVKTSHASVVRFAQAIGFKGYPQLQQELRAVVRQKISPTKILQNMIFQKPKEKIYIKIFQMEMQNLGATRDANPPETLDRVVKEIVRARRIGFIGTRTSHAVAYILYFYLGRVRRNCELLNVGGDLTNQLINFGSGDLLFAISFPRYGRQAIEILKYGKRKGCKIIAITDTPISPAGQLADIVLLAERKSAAYFNSLTSTVALVNCLAAEVSQKSKRFLARLKSYDQVDNEWNYFYNL